MNRKITVICSNCNSEDRWILHNVRLRGAYRKLCTSCLLKLHPSSFCPTCFALHDAANPTPSPQSNRTLICFKCTSLSHATCVPPNAPKSPYLCPPCASPNFKFFDFKAHCNEIQMDDEDSKSTDHQSMDQRSGKALLAATKIAAASMSKAAALAEAEAERRVKEAALARKRAKEALEHLALLVVREGERTKRREWVGELEVSVSMHKRENPRSGELSGAVKNNGGGRREKTGFKVQNAVVQMEKNGGIVGGGSRNETERVVSPPPPQVKLLGLQNLDNVNEKKEGSNDLAPLENNNLQGDNMSNGLASSNSQHLQINHGEKDDLGPH